MDLNTYKKGVITSELLIVGFDHVILRPEKLFFRATYKDAEKDPQNTPAADALIELKLLKIIENAKPGAVERITNPPDNFMSPASVGKSVK